MPPFKDEHILIIAPGSQLTLAQLGLPESFTPAQTRLRTRMFQAPDGKTWEPYKIRQVKKPVVNGADIEMGGTEGENKKVDDEEPEFEEDIESDEDAVYPLTEGRITNMPAFLALLNHVHNTLSPTLHTPILLIAQAAWTAQDHEALTQFFFEKFKTPAFCIMDSALAIAYGYGVQNATVVDVGYKKVDITAITDFSVHHVGRTIALPGGGDAMTERLLELLGPKGWTKDMCEQLKKSQICEILPASVPLPGEGEGAIPSNPAAAASTGATSSGASAKVSDIPRGPGPNTEVGEENLDIDGKVIDDEGVLDVASIVASGKTQEFLAAQEKKKAAAAARKATKDAKDLADSTAKQIRLPNSKRERVIFHYQERKNPDEAEASEQKRQKTPEAGLAEVPTEEGQAPAVVDALDTVVAVDDQSAKKEQARAAKREEKRKAREGQGDPTLFRREIEVGTERFLATTGGNLDNIADAMHRTVSSVVDLGKRAELWESVVIVGNGCRVRGFKESLISLLNSKYIISPSSATIFTSELPSNLSTPMGTGSQTPSREYPGPHPSMGGSGVNPLLLAATTASNPSLNPQQSMINAYGQMTQHSHSSHSQSPTSIKVVKVPEYFPEFKNDGFEEVVFLGAQVAAKVIFVQDQGVSGGFLSRVQYNDLGPSGIHEIGLAF